MGAKAQRILSDGGTVEIEGLAFVMDGDGEVRPGDTYIAERNTGPKLLTCLGINISLSCIVPVENAYCFDTNECIRVKMVED